MTAESWVIVEKGTGRAVFETFSKTTVSKINALKYEAVPIRTYLEKLNRRLNPDPSP